MSTRQEDEVIDLFFARTLDYILFFTNLGRVYSSRVYELPEGSRTARGAHIANVLSLMADETVTTMLVVPDFEAADYVTLITRQGRIKRMELNAFSNVRASGLIAMNLDASDSLDWARLTAGDEEFVVVTRNGKALRFHETTVRSMGRTAGGVRAIRLLDGDQVVSLEVVEPSSDLFILHERGWGKRVPLEEYNAKGRYTQGMWTTDHRRLEETGAIVAARVVHPNDHITVMTANGIVLRTTVSGISRMGRSTRGVRIVNLLEGDTVAAVAVLQHEDLGRGVDQGGEENGQAGGDAVAVAEEAADAAEVVEAAEAAEADGE
jgi:DNA gyrase subunit A